MSYQSQLASINLRHGVRQKDRYGGMSGATFSTAQTNQGTISRLKNQIQTVPFSDAFRQDASLTRKGW